MLSLNSSPEMEEQAMQQWFAHSKVFPDYQQRADELKVQFETVLNFLRAQELIKAFNSFSQLTWDAYSLDAYPHLSILYYQLKAFFKFLEKEISPYDNIVTFEAAFKAGEDCLRRAVELKAQYYPEVERIALN